MLPANPCFISVINVEDLHNDLQSNTMSTTIAATPATTTVTMGFQFAETTERVPHRPPFVNSMMGFGSKRRAPPGRNTPACLKYFACQAARMIFRAFRLCLSTPWRRVAVAPRIQSKYCHKSLQRPAHSSHMKPPFRRGLAKAFEDHGMPNNVQFQNSAIQWCKNFTFIDA